MVSHITRWTAECGCCFELESDPDSDIPEERENHFLLANHICGGHEQHKAKKLLKAVDHSKHANHVKGLIEEIKTRNIDRSMDRITKEEKDTLKIRKLMETHPLVVERNKEITEEWNELVTREYAFDFNVYDIVLKENQEAALKRLQEENP